MRCFLKSAEGSAQEIADSGERPENLLGTLSSRLARPGRGTVLRELIGEAMEVSGIPRTGEVEGSGPLKPPPQLPDRTAPGIAAASRPAGSPSGRSFR